MRATAVSNPVNRKGTAINNTLVLTDTFIMKFLNRDISKWPARMFAVNRTHSVMGRIKLLTSSIITMKCIKAGGVPCGTKCCINLIVFLTISWENLLSHNTKANANENVTCAELAKFWGYNAITLV
jgi:hypothetical protein